MKCIDGSWSCPHSTFFLRADKEGTCFCIGCEVVSTFKDGKTRNQTARKYKVKVDVVDRAIRESLGSNL